MADGSIHPIDREPEPEMAAPALDGPQHAPEPRERTPHRVRMEAWRQRAARPLDSPATSGGKEALLA